MSKANLYRKVNIITSPNYAFPVIQYGELAPDPDIDKLRLERAKRVKGIQKKLEKFAKKYLDGNKDIGNIYFEEQYQLSDWKTQWTPCVVMASSYEVCRSE